MDDPKKRIVRLNRIELVDLTASSVYVGVDGQHPHIGSYPGGLCVEDVGIDCTGTRHVRLVGEVRQIVMCLQMIGRDDVAQEFLVKNGLHPRAFTDVGLPS